MTKYSSSFVHIVSVFPSKYPFMTSMHPVYHGWDKICWFFPMLALLWLACGWPSKIRYCQINIPPQPMGFRLQWYSASTFYWALYWYWHCHTTRIDKPLGWSGPRFIAFLSSSIQLFKLGPFFDLPINGRNLYERVLVMILAILYGVVRSELGVDVGLQKIIQVCRHFPL